MLRLVLSVFLVLMLANPWQFAPPTDPDGAEGNISNLSLFVPPAAAEEAYLVTELGNVFPVEDSSKNTDDLTKAPIAAISTFFMSANAKMDSIPHDSSLWIVAGNTAKGESYSFEPHFTIPSDIAEHPDGYVSMFHNIENYEDPITIRNFFGEYRYDDSQRRLVNITSYGTVPDADFVSLLGPHSSISTTTGTMLQYGNGFGVSEPGTYAIKLLPDTVYWLDYGDNCVGDDCDSISIISTDSNLLGITPSGLTVASYARFKLTQDTTGISGTRNYGTARVNLKVFAPIDNVQISDASNIRSTPPVTFSMNEEAWCGLSRRRVGYREIGNYTFVKNSFTPDTQTRDGLTFIDSIYATSKDNISWQRMAFPFWCDINRYVTENLPRMANFHSSSGVTVYDVGVPVRSHIAYWSQDPSDAMYSTGTTTKHNPSVVVIDDNDTYMIVEKTTSHQNRVKIGASYTNETGGLRITDLPLNTAYQIKDNYGLVISGSTDDSGIISIPHESRPFRIAGDMSLNILEDMETFTEMSGMNLYDIKNHDGMHVSESKFDGVVYSTTQYLKLPLVFDTVVQDVELKDVDCTGDGLSLSYISGSYTVADRYIWIPVVPGFEMICITINNSEVALRYGDFLPSETISDAESSRHEVSTAPSFNFRKSATNSHNDVPRVPVSGITGRPMDNSIYADSSSQFVVVAPGEMSITVSGNANAGISTHVIREYSDSSLTGSFADIEDSTVEVTFNVYKNGNLEKTEHVGTYTSSSLERDTRIGSLPEEDDKRYWWYKYYRYHNLEPQITPNPKPELKMPEYFCSTTGGPRQFSRSVSYTHYSCIYKHDSASRSFCELKMSYNINGNFHNGGVSFEVKPGDVIKYDISAKLRANHNGFDCGNDHTATYGNTDLSVDLTNVIFKHDIIQG